MEHDASFGHWLTERRRAMRLQRTELATRIGCATVTLQKIESDERRPSREFAERLAEKIGIAPDERETFVRVARGELPVDRLAVSDPAESAPSTLPRPPTALIGRGRELEQVRTMLLRPEVRLLTITGAPGVGKSRLALEAAHTLQPDFADGVFLVPLAAVSDPDLVLVALADVLGVGTAGGAALPERLGRTIGARRLLLLLDNLEHLLSAGPSLLRLLAVAPGLKLLTTSRVALDLSGEHRFAVLPLTIPPASNSRQLILAPDHLRERYDAVELFVQRARAVAPSFTLNDGTLAAVGEICRRLDGLPLAIELAAARTALFTPHELLARLDNRFALLTSRNRDLSPRHVTLLHAIAWSYDLLSPADQRLFRRLGVFAGGCSIEAAQAVCNADGALGSDVVDSIESLIASSLLHRVEGMDGRSRFTMLETVREYAQSQLAASGEEAAMRQRHAAHYLALAEAAERVWDRTDEWPWIQRLVATRENVRAALRWMTDSGDVATALRFGAALFKYWIAYSALPEARSWIEALLALPMPDDLTARVDRGRILNAGGYVVAEMADHATAAAYFDEALALYRAQGDSDRLAWALRGRAFGYLLHEAYDEAERLYSESLRLATESGNRRELAWTLYARAFLRLAQGDLTQARPAMEEALVMLRAEDIAFGVFRALMALGHIHFEQGAMAMAAHYFREALTMSRPWPLLTYLTIGLDGMGMVAAIEGQAGRAARLLGATEALRESTNELRWRLFQASYERALDLARAQMSPAEWASAWAEGRALSVEAAVAEALADE